MAIADYRGVVVCGRVRKTTAEHPSPVFRSGRTGLGIFVTVVSCFFFGRTPGAPSVDSLLESRARENEKHG